MLLSRGWSLLILTGAAIGVLIIFSRPDSQPVSQADQLDQTLLYLQNNEFDKAEELACVVLNQSPDSVDALLYAGEAASRAGRVDDGLAYYDRVAPESPRWLETQFYCGDILLHTGRLSEAGKRFKTVLSKAPPHQKALSRLAQIQHLVGQRFEARQSARRLLRLGDVSLNWLQYCGSPLRQTKIPKAITEQHAARTDPLIAVALAARQATEGNVSPALAELTEVCSNYPDLTIAHLTYGQIRITTADDWLCDWLQQLPADATDFPAYWMTLGEAARLKGERRSATRCFWEAFLRDHNDPQICYRLGQALREEQHPAAPLLQKRLDQLRELEQAVDDIAFESSVAPLMRRAAQLTRSLGRLEESAGWYLLLLGEAPNDQEATRELSRIHEQVAAGRNEDLMPFANQLDLSDRKVPEWKCEIDSPSGTSPQISEREDVSRIQFEEVTNDVGIRFKYYSSPDPATDGVRMIEINGGGVGAIDFDLDGWPDLHFTQGCRWPVDRTSDEFQDQLFQNLDGNQFRSVTTFARVGEVGFSQGVSAGDVNNDGFDDLYIANIGRNQLYLNCGDGTFVNAQTTAELRAIWTSSCAIIDVNGDGAPDLYDVNYVTGEAAETRICGGNDGRADACSPARFDAAEDQLWQNQGDCEFLDTSEASGIVDHAGRGLGILAMWNGGNRPGLFIANDGEANFFFTRNSSNGRFSENAQSSSLAFDGDGNRQACMGIACGDADGDKRLDLFVTNYFREHNTLYRQLGVPGMFEDASIRTGLRQPSLSRLGFGTQFLDADLDGWQDIVLVNGHVADLSRSGVPYRMNPQVFRNLSGQRFKELPPDTAGQWFSKKQLGRGLARLDWNRDGRPDFAVSHLDTPAALLSNTSEPTGGFVVIHLRGRTSSRDGTGAAVELGVEGRRVLRREITGGDGYQSSNSKRLLFGIGNTQHIDQATVFWPSGKSQTFEDIPRNSEWIVIEEGPAVQLPRADE